MSKLADAGVKEAIEREFADEGLEVVCRWRKRAWVIYWAEDMEPLARLRPAGHKGLFRLYWWDGDRWCDLFRTGRPIPLQEALQLILDDPFDVFGIETEEEWVVGLGSGEWDFEREEESDEEEGEEEEGELEYECTWVGKFLSELSHGLYRPDLRLGPVILRLIAACIVATSFGAAAASFTSALVRGLLALAVALAALEAVSIGAMWLKGSRFAATDLVRDLALSSFFSVWISLPAIVVGFYVRQSLEGSGWAVAAGVLTSWGCLALCLKSRKMARYIGAVAGLAVALWLAEALGWSTGPGFLLAGAFCALWGALLTALGYGLLAAYSAGA